MEKRWQFVAVVAEEALVVAAVANFRYVGYGFAYAHRRDTGETRRFEVKTPLGLGAQVALEPEKSFSRLSVPTGYLRYDPAPQGPQKGPEGRNPCRFLYPRGCR